MHRAVPMCHDSILRGDSRPFCMAINFANLRRQRPKNEDQFDLPICAPRVQPNTYWCTVRSPDRPPPPPPPASSYSWPALLLCSSSLDGKIMLHIWHLAEAEFLTKSPFIRFGNIINFNYRTCDRRATQHNNALEGLHMRTNGYIGSAC